MTTPKTGPFTREELMSLWVSATDPAYHQPLLENPDSGVEVIEQAADQYARASLMVDKTTQAMFILPWSGQTNPPAAGASFATVTLKITRGDEFQRQILLLQGLVFFEERARDYGPDGFQLVPTGRRYTVQISTGFHPGQSEIFIRAVAERPGFGYNLPLPESITAISQAGAGLNNVAASVVPGTAGTNRLVVAPNADVIAPENVGAYIQFDAGLNAGRRVRMVGYEGPDPSVPHGGVAILSAEGVLRHTGITGTFSLGEEFVQAVSLARGRVLIGPEGDYIAYERVSGELVAGQVITGQQGGATATVYAVEISPALVAETATAAWRVLGWEADLLLEVVNEDSPTGGVSPMLDELGAERNIHRAAAESDDTYRPRVHALPDTISPNAVRRAANRVLAPHGLSVCLREVGDIDNLFPGFFYDVVTNPQEPRYAYAYDLNFTQRPQDRFKLVMDYLEMRAFMLIGVPATGLGDFGMAFDALTDHNAYDAAPYLAFYDGYPLTEAAINRGVWDAVAKAKAAGVGFDLYQERLGCF